MDRFPGRKMGLVFGGNFGMHPKQGYPGVILNGTLFFLVGIKQTANIWYIISCNFEGFPL